jgi:Flp pilus assembly protein TadG
MMELVLVAPILFALIFGIFDFGRGMSANVTVTNSAREGARYLATHATSWSTPSVALPSSQGRFDTGCQGVGSSPGAPAATTAQGAAWRQMQAANLALSSVVMKVRFYASNNDPSNGGAANDTFTCDSSGTMNESTPTYTPQSGDWVQFEVSYQYSPVTPFISGIFHTVTMDQTTTMVLE